MPFKSTIQKRLWDRAIKTDTCWIWQGHTDRNGYGSLMYQGRMQRAHRVSYMIVIGPIPNGLLICHTCDNPSCIRPDHLFPGTHQENMHDASIKKHFRQHGTHNAQAILNDDKVRDIRQQATNKIPYKDIAAFHSVSVGTVSAIIHRRRWKHVV